MPLTKDELRERANRAISRSRRGCGHTFCERCFAPIYYTMQGRPMELDDSPEWSEHDCPEGEGDE